MESRALETLSLPGVPQELVCEILRSLTVKEILRLSHSNTQIRSYVLGCPLVISEDVPMGLFRALSSFTFREILGTITGVSFRDLPEVSSRISGDFRIQLEDDRALYEDPSVLFVRTRLYPGSETTVSYQDQEKRYEFSWKPQEETLRLLLPYSFFPGVDEVVFETYLRILAPILPRVRTLTLNIQNWARGPNEQLDDFFDLLEQATPETVILDVDSNPSWIKKLYKRPDVRIREIRAERILPRGDPRSIRLWHKLGAIFEPGRSRLRKRRGKDLNKKVLPKRITGLVVPLSSAPRALTLFPPPILTELFVVVPASHDPQDLERLQTQNPDIVFYWLSQEKRPG